MLESKFSPEIERKKAEVTDIIYTSEQEYIDPERRYAHNDLYPSAIVEVIKIEGEKALVRDATGEFWVPIRKLEL